MNFFKKYKEIIAYLFWGVMTTIVSWGTYSIFVILFKDLQYEIELFIINCPVVVFLSNILSWVFAVMFAFVTNKLWVFDSKSWERKVVSKELCKFIAARLITGVLEIVGVPLLVSVGINQKIFGIEGIVAKIIVSVAVVVLNYVYSKLFVFMKKS